MATIRNGSARASAAARQDALNTAAKASASPVLDSFDLAILDILQRDNTTAQREIAQAVNLSAPAVQRRIKRLRESGMILSETAVLNASLLGRPLTIMVEVHVHDEQPSRTAGLRRRIQAEPAVQQCYSITGEADYLLVLTAATMADYEAISSRLFDGDENVRRFRTSVALGCLKLGLQIPLKA
ncbi:Lrp/AsnC family transcriptional regulator [Kerstersia sp.]|uniref:Lrp/AsnC family transcriptional regulator n=1 Tax=Kerstersia sp. TaxID=1930783 RepID=UPI003F8DE9F6